MSVSVNVFEYHSSNVIAVRDDAKYCAEYKSPCDVLARTRNHGYTTAWYEIQLAI